ADHADFDLVLVAPGGPTVIGEDGRSVAVAVDVDQLERSVVGRNAYDRQHGAEDLVGIDAHLRRDVVEQGWAEPESLGVTVDLRLTAVDHEVSASLNTGIEVGRHLV